MSYKALLFCPEEKTARVVTQVLSELEFQVEPCNEPFAAVKRLMAEHFDAVVVDCENEQNATLLFRSAKNSGSNQTSLSVAVVEGQSGVAKAFRIGANLVLTKPINVEQSKGTLRVARGLLRKTDGSKTATLPAISEPHVTPGPSAPISTPKPAFPSVTETPKMAAFSPPPAPPAPPAPVASAGSQFELDAEPGVKLEPTEAALLESMPDPLAGKAASLDQSSSKPSPWQPASQAMAEPMASALKHATDAATEPSATAAARNNSSSVLPAGRPVLVSGGAAAAAAPAKARPEIEETAPQEIEPHVFSSSIGQPLASESGASKKMIVIAATVLVVAAVSYFGWKNKAALGAVTGVLHKPTIPAPAKPATTQPSAVPATLAPPYSAEVVATPAPAVPERKPVPNNETPILATTAPATTIPAAVTTSPAPKKSASTPKAIAEAPAPVKTIADDGAADALVVKGNSAKPVIQAAPPQEEVAEANAPEASSIASGSDSSAVSGLVSLPTNTPQAAPQTLKVSQGVSQGLLIKKVAPVYPPQAMRMGVQGAVQLSAHISKSGDITNIQVLSGDNLLSQAAVDAVKQWKYKPYYLDSQPVEIQTQITMNFKLP
jgi:periplasmic protein TonB